MSRAQRVPNEAPVGPPGVRRTDAHFSSARILCLLFPIGCLGFSIVLGLPSALYAPDSAQYRLLALGQRGAVPAPFSARVLGPAIAGWLGRASGHGVDTGFLALGILCLAVLITLIAGYLWSWRAPVTIFAAVFLMPFWVDMFHDYYLPDLLHGVLLAAVLACLFYGYTALGLLLLFPAFLARESTILVAFCLVVAGWRRIPAGTALVGVLAVAAGRLVSAHYSQGGPASVHELSGGFYMLGKLVWSVSRNLLGLPLWSNTLPECSPIWSTSLPNGAHLGAIRSVGLCRPSAWGPGRLALAWFGVFGLGPAFALAFWRSIFLPSALSGKLWRSANASPLRAVPHSAGAILVFRFCIIYGLICVLTTPLLGASADRLVEYGWPFYFVVLPWFLGQSCELSSGRGTALVCLHLLTCWVAWFGFRQQTTGYVLTGAAVLAANGLGYLMVQRYRFGYLSLQS